MGAHFRPRGSLGRGRADVARSREFGPHHDGPHPRRLRARLLAAVPERANAAYTPVFVSALERPDRSEAWLEQKLREEGKLRALRNYPLTPEEAFAAAGEPYFDPALLESADEDALQPYALKGDRYLKAWDVGRKDASVCVVLRAPSSDEVPVLHVVGYKRLVGEDYPAIQAAIEAMHAEYPGPTVIEANSVGALLSQNVRIPKDQVIEHTTTEASKQAMLTEIELRLQQQTLKIHREFDQLLTELANYRVPDKQIVQDSVMALGFAVANADKANARAAGGGINRELFYELNGGTLGPSPSWLNRQKITTDGPSWGLVPVIRDVSDPRELNRYKADALTGELEAMLARGWRVADPAALDKLGLRLPKMES